MPLSGGSDGDTNVRIQVVVAAPEFWVSSVRMRTGLAIEDRTRHSPSPEPVSMDSGERVGRAPLAAKHELTTSRTPLTA
jgi:hypothetical protein